MTTTNATKVLSADQLATQTALLPLLKEFKASEAKISRSLGLIEKQNVLIALNRAIGGRVIAKMLLVPGMTTAAGRPIASKLATATGMGNDSAKMWITGANLVTVQVAAGELIQDETPNQDEIDLMNSPWEETAANKRGERAANKGKGKGEATDGEATADKDTRDSDGTKGGEADTIGLTFADIMTKVNELKATVELAARSNVTVTDADNESLNEVMAGIMATLSSMQ